jgi:hypothetical protein
VLHSLDFGDPGLQGLGTVDPETVGSSYMYFLLNFSWIEPYLKLTTSGRCGETKNQFKRKTSVRLRMAFS